MTEEEFNEEMRKQEIERTIKTIDEKDAFIEEQYRNGDRLFFHHKRKIGEDEIDVDLMTFTHIENGFLKGIDIANDAVVRIEDESGDPAFGIRIEYDELNCITRVSRVLIDEEQKKDGISTSYDLDGNVEKIELWEVGDLIDTIWEC